MEPRTARTSLVRTGTVNSPRLRPVLRMVDAIGGFFLGGLERRPVTMEALRRAAERKTGLRDWGLTPDYQRACELLDKDIADHPRNFIGREALWDLLLRLHLTRLKTRRAIAEAPAGMGFKRPPFFVTGLFRTGTTLMHNLLSALPDRDSLPAYELFCPVPEPGREVDAQRMARSAGFIAPETQIIHPMQWDAPEECWIAVASTMRTHAWGVVSDVPTYVAWLDVCPRRPAGTSGGSHA